MIIYFESAMGCGLREARSLESGERAVVRECGTANGPYKVRKAREEDIAWVEAMGGYVPKGARNERSQRLVS